MASLAIGVYDESVRLKAEALAQSLSLPINNRVFPQLRVSASRLELLYPPFSPLSVDFEKHRLKTQAQVGKKPALVKACKPAQNVFILDVTAGWGRDAAMLASWGSKVLMIERNPVVSALLEDGLERLKDDSPMRARLSLYMGDATVYLEHLKTDDRPDVIYMDPMHPERQKKAKVQKEMQALQQLLGVDEDAQMLLETAIENVRNKVVVKWPQRLKPMFAPDVSYPGKTVRFDVYLARG